MDENWYLIESVSVGFLTYSCKSFIHLHSEIFIPPQTVFGGGGGVYCFDVVLPSVLPSVRNTSNL